MKKIRINELARELEVKPGSIIDLLLEYGVTEKKTHSSSIDEDVADLIKVRLAGQGRSGGYEPEPSDFADHEEGPAEDNHVPAPPAKAVESQPIKQVSK